MSPLLPLAAVCALAYLPLAARPASRMRSITKTMSVALLALTAALGQGPHLLVLALAMCAIGDWFLSRDGDGAFMAGIGAFAAGHLAYITLFLTHPLADTAGLWQPPQIWGVAGLALVGAAAAVILVPRAGDLGLPVLAYIPIILGMGVCALALPGQGALGWALPAALAFVVSDLVLAVEKFLLPEGHAMQRATPYLVWPFYWAAQAGFFAAFA